MPVFLDKIFKSVVMDTHTAKEFALAVCDFADQELIRPEEANRVLAKIIEFLPAMTHFAPVYAGFLFDGGKTGQNSTLSIIVNALKNRDERRVAWGTLADVFTEIAKTGSVAEDQKFPPVIQMDEAHLGPRKPLHNAEKLIASCRRLACSVNVLEAA